MQHTISNFVVNNCKLSFSSVMWGTNTRNEWQLGLKKDIFFLLFACIDMKKSLHQTVFPMLLKFKWFKLAKENDT